MTRSDDASGSRPWWIPRGLRAVPVAQTGLSALILGVLLHLRDGYQAGGGEHQALSVTGMHWARPEWFAGDWAVANVARPALSFDAVTWFGTTIGALGATYLAYWIAALLVFGAATTLLAQAWAASRAWLAVVTVSVLAGLTPVVVLGVTSPLRAVAVPSVLGGTLVYLAVAALLTGRHRLAASVAIAAAVVDLSSGAIAVLLLAAVLVGLLVRTGGLDRTLAAGVVGSVIVIGVTSLVLPAAGRIGEFAEACRTVLAANCDATTFPRSELRIGASTIVFSGLTAWYLTRENRWRYWSVVALPLVGALGAVGVEVLRVPWLATLAQGLFLPGLASALFGLIGWGVVAPLLVPVSARLRWVLTAVVVVLGLGALDTVRGVGTDRGHWALDANLDQLRPPWAAMLGFVLVIGCAVLTVPEFGARRARTAPAAAMAALVVVALVSASFGQLSLRQFDPRFGVRDPDLVAWGAQVADATPAGAVLIVPPARGSLRLVTHRAVLADCTLRPIGGTALVEFTDRLAAIGGVAQCSPKGQLGAYGDASAADLTVAARRFGVGYIAVDSTTTWRVQALTEVGWSVRVGPRGTATLTLLAAPWA